MKYTINNEVHKWKVLNFKKIFFIGVVFMNKDSSSAQFTKLAHTKQTSRFIHKKYI